MFGDMLYRAAVFRIRNKIRETLRTYRKVRHICVDQSRDSDRRMDTLQNLNKVKRSSTYKS